MFYLLLVFLRNTESEPLLAVAFITLIHAILCVTYVSPEDFLLCGHFGFGFLRLTFVPQNAFLLCNSDKRSVTLRILMESGYVPLSAKFILQSFAYYLEIIIIAFIMYNPESFVRRTLTEQVT